MRKNLFEYDQVLNTQRDKVYSLRRQALQEPDLAEQLLDFSNRTMDDILEVCYFLKDSNSCGAWINSAVSILSSAHATSQQTSDLAQQLLDFSPHTMYDILEVSQITEPQSISLTKY